MDWEVSRGQRGQNTQQARRMASPGESGRWTAARFLWASGCAEDLCSVSQHGLGGSFDCEWLRDGEGCLH